MSTCWFVWGRLSCRAQVVAALGTPTTCGDPIEKKKKELKEGRWETVCSAGDTERGWQNELWISVLLLVAGHHSHVSLRLPVSCLCSDQPGAKPPVQAVPTLALGKEACVTFRPSPFNNALSTCLYSIRSLRSNEMSFIAQDDHAEEKCFLLFYAVTPLTLWPSVLKALKAAPPWIWCPRSLTQVDRPRHE